MIGFQNRTEAAMQLSDKLSLYGDKNPLVLGIPRGGVPMASIIATQLGGDLDVILVHKLGAPEQPELAIGAIDESGEVYIHPYAEDLQVPKSYIEEEKLKQLQVLQRRRRRFTPHRQPLDPKGRTVIVVDDGIATGSTMVAALHSLKAKNPKELIVAIPLAPESSLPQLKEIADQVICLRTPEPFYAVGQFYRDFTQVTDEEVVELLSHKKVASA